MSNLLYLEAKCTFSVKGLNQNRYHRQYGPMQHQLQQQQPMEHQQQLQFNPISYFSGQRIPS